MTNSDTEAKRASAVGLSMRTAFVSVRSPIGTLSGLFDLPPSASESNIRDLERAMSESVAEVVSDWLVTVTGEHDDAS